MRSLLLALVLIGWSGMALAAGTEMPFTELSGASLEQHKSVTLAEFEGKKALLIFWSSDCAPCLKELTILPEMAADNPDLPIALIALQDEAHAKRHLSAMPANVHVLMALKDGKDVLEAFGGQALPFSMALHPDGRCSPIFSKLACRA